MCGVFPSGHNLHWNAVIRFWRWRLSAWAPVGKLASKRQLKKGYPLELAYRLANISGTH